MPFLGKLLNNKGKSNEAEMHFKIAIELDPMNSSALNNLEKIENMKYSSCIVF